MMLMKTTPPAAPTLLGATATNFPWLAAGLFALAGLGLAFYVKKAARGEWPRPCPKSTPRA